MLTTEAGLNDGVALPFLLLGIAVVRGDLLVWGVAVGGGAGAVLGRLVAVGASALREREFLAADFDRWVGLAAGFIVFGAAEARGALGFVAARCTTAPR